MLAVIPLTVVGSLWAEYIFSKPSTAIGFPESEPLLSDLQVKLPWLGAPYRAAGVGISAVELWLLRIVIILIFKLDDLNMDKHELDSPSIFQMKPCVLAGETHENGQSNSVFGRERHGAAILLETLSASRQIVCDNVGRKPVPFCQLCDRWWPWAFLWTACQTQRCRFDQALLETVDWVEEVDGWEVPLKSFERIRSLNKFGDGGMMPENESYTSIATGVSAAVGRIEMSALVKCGRSLVARLGLYGLWRWFLGTRKWPETFRRQQPVVEVDRDPCYWSSHVLESGIWVCLKIGYIPNYSHLIGIMIINHWV